MLTPLIPFIRDSFSLSYTQTGFLVSAFTLTYGIAQLPGGWLSDHMGPHRLIFIGISGMALCGLIIGFSTNYILLVVFLILMGIMGGGYHPSASPLILSTVDEKIRGRVLGIHQIGGTGSFFLAPLVAVAIARVIGWRGSFLSVSMPTLAFGIVFFMLLNRWGFTQIPTKAKSDNKADLDEKKGQILSLLPVMTLSIFIQTFINSAISFIPLYVVDKFGGSKEAAAMVLSIAYFAGIWAGPLAGYLSDRIGIIPIVLFTGIIAGPLIYLLNHVSLGVSVSAILLLLGMTQYMSMPVTEVYVINHAPKKNRSTILGIYYFASRGGPGLLAPVMGYIIDRYSFSTAFLFTGAVMGTVGVICSVIILLTREWKK
ncbi:MAG: MFS transporter [Spirochaetota bacterium]|nr:MAG: MFS transporter [Spirochaetota bacterium]